MNKKDDPEYHKNWRKEQKQKVLTIISTVEQVLEIFRKSARDYNYLLADDTINTVAKIEENVKEWRIRYEPRK